MLKFWNKKKIEAPDAAHVLKQKAIHEYRERYKPGVFVETGTYLGDMVEAQKEYFTKVYSIELSKKLYKRAVNRFKGDTNVKLLQGDSGKVLNNLLPELKQVTLFWLDGHYSEGITAKGELECPVREEMDAILKSDQMHVILIDDARMFNGTHDYPTIDELKSIIAKSTKPYQFELKDDIIRLTPKN